MEPDDLVPAREILRLFPDLPRHALYELVKRGLITAYEQPKTLWRQKKLCLYDPDEVRRVLGEPR